MFEGGAEMRCLIVKQFCLKQALVKMNILIFTKEFFKGAGIYVPLDSKELKYYIHLL